MTDFEIRADGSMKISGYVNAVGRDSRPVMTPDGRVIEQIQPGAFGEALRAAPKVDVLLNHDISRRIAGTEDGTAKLAEDSIGLRAEVIITDTEVISKAKNGELRGWSFGFCPLSGGVEIEQRADKLPRRIVKHMTISEVSLIDSRYNPCYAGTSVECRAEGAAEEYRAELDEVHCSSHITAAELEQRYNAAVMKSYEASIYDGSVPIHDYG